MCILLVLMHIIRISSFWFISSYSWNFFPFGVYRFALEKLISAEGRRGFRKITVEFFAQAARQLWIAPKCNIRRS